MTWPTSWGVFAPLAVGGIGAADERGRDPCNNYIACVIAGGYLVI